MNVRRLTAEDAALYQDLRLQGLLDTPTAFLNNHEDEVGREETFIAQRLSAEDAATYGAFVDGRLVGIASVRRDDHPRLNHKAGIGGVYVYPSQRGNGIGRAVMQAVMAHAFEKLGVRQINLGVNAANPSAITLYERLGYETYGLEKDFMCCEGVYHDEMHMVCFKSAFDPGT